MYFSGHLLLPEEPASGHMLQMDEGPYNTWLSQVLQTYVFYVEAGAYGGQEEGLVTDFALGIKNFMLCLFVKYYIWNT